MKTLAPLLLLTGLAPGMNAAEPRPAPVVSSLASLPDAHGYAGMFAGVSGGALLCAGGANFPEKALAQGGKKIWSDRVFVLSTPTGPWREVGRLPRANGYGVSATWRDSVVIAGGGNAQENFRAVALMHWDGVGISFAALPDLPAPVANGCGTVVGDILYVAGGQDTPSATSTLSRCFALNLAAIDHAWREIPWPIGPAGRILSVAAAHDGWFYLISGADLSANAQGQPERRYLTDAWRYRPDAGWQRLSDLPHAVAAAPSPAMSDGGTRLVIAGGVSPEFLATLPKNAPHPGFPNELLTYDTATNTWTAFAPSREGPPSRVTAPLAPWHDRWVIPSGEVAPGIRTPTVLSFRFAP
jgi:N-acetylneuraminate epimerase